MSSPTVLVLGAAGRFGAAAVQAFSDAGWRVVAQQRKAPAQRRGVQLLQASLDDVDTVVRAAAGATVVVHAVNPPYDRWDAELLPLFEQGLAIATRLGARFMLPGNVYAYGEHMPALLREDTPERPSTLKGRLRQRMEAELERRAAQGLDSVVIRAGDFFGGGTGSWLDLAVVKDLARGRLVYPGPLDHVHAWAYLPDLARAFVAVAADGGHRGCLKLHFAGHAVSGRDFIDAVAAAAASIGLRPDAGWRVGGMPWPLLRLAGLFSPTLREVVRMSYLWRVPHALDGSALARHVGPLPHTALEVALRQSLLDLGLGRTTAATATG